MFTIETEKICAESPAGWSRRQSKGTNGDLHFFEAGAHRSLCGRAYIDVVPRGGQPRPPNPLLLCGTCVNRLKHAGRETE